MAEYKLIVTEKTLARPTCSESPLHPSVKDGPADTDSPDVCSFTSM